MFCPKCGTQSLEGAAFCQKCGAKLIVDTHTDQTSRTSPAQQPNPAPVTIAGKKKSKLPVIIGVIMVVILAIVFIALNWEGKVDYEATVRDYKPFDILMTHKVAR